LLNWFERLIRRRRETPELGLGTWRTIANDVDAVLAHRCDWEDVTTVALHNFSPDACRVTFALDDDSDDLREPVALQDLLEGGTEEVDGPKVTVELGRYGYRWFRIQRAGQRRTP
jgi:hypothetical protein